MLTIDDLLFIAIVVWLLLISVIVLRALKNKEEIMSSIKNVVKVVTDNLEDIDSRIVNALVNWKLDRVSKVNLTILRLAVGEMLFVDDVPGSVAINEAVELTKKYSDEKSTSFVNGVLDKVLKTLE